MSERRVLGSWIRIRWNFSLNTFNPSLPCLLSLYCLSGLGLGRLLSSTLPPKFVKGAIREHWLTLSPATEDLNLDLTTIPLVSRPCFTQYSPQFSVCRNNPPNFLIEEEAQLFQPLAPIASLTACGSRGILRGGCVFPLIFCQPVLFELGEVDIASWLMYN